MAKLTSWQKYDRHFGDVRAVGLFKDGELAGKIVAKYMDSGVCHVYVWLFKDTFSGYGNAGGWGYDKFSTALWEALEGSEYQKFITSGGGNVNNELSKAGFEVVSIL